jgi:hypothetical protein
MKRIAKIIIGRYITFLPLIIFMISYRIWSSWKTAFTVGGTVSCLYLLFVFYEHIRHDLIMTGVNCFLIGGAAMSIFKLRWLGNMYRYFGYTTILVWIFVVGLIATIFSEEGFVGIKHANKKLVTLFSIYLLAGTLLSICFSIYFAKQIFKLGAIPFVFLLVLRALLVARLKRVS